MSDDWKFTVEQLPSLLFKRVKWGGDTVYIIDINERRPGIFYILCMFCGNFGFSIKLCYTKEKHKDNDLKNVLFTGGSFFEPEIEDGDYYNKMKKQLFNRIFMCELDRNIIEYFKEGE
jgi:hypothetical protein